MSCMPWYKVHSGWSTHEKVLSLCALLRDDRADAYVGRLWDYCAQKRGDGRFSGPAAGGLLEAAVRFAGPAGALVDALVVTGLVERHPDGALEVHDWVVEQRAIASKFEVDRARPNSRVRKPKARNNVAPQESRECPANVPRGVPLEPRESPANVPPKPPGGRVESREIQTPTESVGPAHASGRPPPEPGTHHLPGMEPAPPPTPEHKPSRQDHEWVRWAAEQRKATAPPDAPAETKLRRDQWARVADALKAHGRLLLEAAFGLYLGDEYARSQAYPLALFIAQWPDWVGKAQAHAARARTGPPGAAPLGTPRKLVEM